MSTKQLVEPTSDREPNGQRPALKRGGSPCLHPDLVRRAALLDWFKAHRAPAVLTIFAPAGYGKTTLLAQAAEADQRPCAWVSLEEGDNDPIVLATHLAEALDRIANAGPGVVDALRLPATALWSTTVPRLGAALASAERPAVIVLDDVHVIGGASLDVVAALAAYVPPRSQLMLAGRGQPRLPLARLRAERRLCELGTKDLAFDATEAASLLRAAGVDLAEPDVAKLTWQTEGWAAGLYLTALSLRTGGTFDREIRSTRPGPDHYIADYLRLEVLSRITPREVEFLTRTAVLERMCGPLCDAVLEDVGSATMLESLERSNRFLVPLDSTRDWYRYHHLFRELLVRELERREPGVIPTLNRRAADWCEQNGAPEAAIDYAFAGNDVARAARLVMVCSVSAYQGGRLETARRWIERLDQAGLLARYPAIAALGAWGEGASGHPVEAERLASVAERSSSEEPMPDGSPSIEPWTAAIRAQMCRKGVEQMQADAKRALELSPRWSFVRSVASLAFGISFVLAGDESQADGALTEATEVAQDLGQHGQRSFALAERSLLAAGRDDLVGAERLARDAQRVVVDAGLDGYMTSAATYVALGRVALLRGGLARAEGRFRCADRLRPLLTDFLPYLAVQVRLELARARIALGDAGGAQILLREVDQLLRRVPALGVLVEQTGELRDQVKAMRALSGDWAPLLTAAELRVLPLLATHLTMAEIAERNFVSRATVKTQAISIYRKLEVTKRGEAVERAVALGLVDPAAVPRSRGLDLAG
jgi:LuxR family transcriptional regulator, maltose regulon positive regulatory protein